MIRALPVLIAVHACALAASPLTGLPSAPGGHIAKIRSLGEGEWLDLGSPAADPQWGKARGRAWGGKMAFAPGLGGAFLTGEGVHGFVKPDGHYMDDLWFYDVNAHRWICCHPGSDARTLSLHLDANGFEVGEDGTPVPVAPLVHAYENITYDSDLRRFMFVTCPGEYWKKSLGERRKQWTVPGAKLRLSSPWFFDVASGKFDRSATERAPRTAHGDTLIYLPAEKRTFLRHLDEVWFYDAATNRWTEAKPSGPKPPFGIDATACLDTKRQRIYFGGGSYPVVANGKNALWIYDLKANAWVDPKPSGSCGGSNSYNTNSASMQYDPVADAVLVFRTGGVESVRGVWRYSPADNAWSPAPVTQLPKLRTFINAFYDTALNAYFFHSAGDSEDNGAMWVFRHRRE